jgi:hypothetical protein
MGDLGENNGPALRRSKWWKTCPASSSSGVAGGIILLACSGGIILLACYSIEHEPLNYREAGTIRNGPIVLLLILSKTSPKRRSS